ncbi:MAG: sialate O-acetylesterase [Kiritimatiellia bacterium]
MHFDVNDSGRRPGQDVCRGAGRERPDDHGRRRPLRRRRPRLSRCGSRASRCARARPTGIPTTTASERTKKAMEQGTLAAILWHQGESDCMRRGGYLYQVRFPLLVSRLRTELDAEGVPLIVGRTRPEERIGLVRQNHFHTTRP